MQFLLDAFPLGCPEASDEEARVGPGSVDLGRGLDQARQVMIELLVPRAGQQADDRPWPFLLLLDEGGVELLAAQFVEVRMADIAGGDAAPVVPRLLERQRTQHMI